MLVVLYHFFKPRLTGGFVGVDVFFVISGFLISSLLFREIQTTGRISLWKFYARRFRRLLPVATVVMVAIVLVASVVIGPLRLIDILHDMAWAVVSLANVRFAQGLDGYFAVAEPSPFLHFWSLAVEEQYYLAWPLLLTALGLAGRRRNLAVLVTLGAVFAASIAASVLLTNSGSPHAYYSLGTRAWELAIGGILAWLAYNVRLRPSTWVARLAGVVGAVGILASAMLYTDATPFPGWTAIVPTMGTALLIWSGSHDPRGPLTRALSIRPAVFVGNISYSLYLWHWPVLVFGAAMLGRGRVAALGLVAVSFVLATLTYYLVEQPSGRFRKLAPSRNVVAIGVSTAIVLCGFSLTATALVPTSSGAISATAPPDGNLADALAGPGMTPRAVPANVQPTLDKLVDDLASVFTNGCYTTTLRVCEGGDPDGEVTVVLTGDSHAGQWWPALDAAGKDRGWKLYIVGKNGCPLANVEITKASGAEPWPECAQWQHDAVGAVLKLKPDLVVFANAAQAYRSTKVSMREGFLEKWGVGVETTISRLAADAPVLMLGESPTLSADPETCLSENMHDVAACSTPIKRAVNPDIQALNKQVASAAGAAYFDPTNLLCTSTCPMMTYNMIMYRDAGHLSATYSASLAPVVGDLVAGNLP